MKTYTVITTTKRTSVFTHTLDSLSACQLPAEFSGTLVIENGSDLLQPGGQFGHELSRPAYEKLNIIYKHLRRPNKSLALNWAIDAYPLYSALRA